MQTCERKTRDKINNVEIINRAIINLGGHVRHTDVRNRFSYEVQSLSHAFGFLGGG